jgi:hypothetical protein
MIIVGKINQRPRRNGVRRTHDKILNFQSKVVMTLKYVYQQLLNHTKQCQCVTILILNMDPICRMKNCNLTTKEKLIDISFMWKLKASLFSLHGRRKRKNVALV